MHQFAIFAYAIGIADVVMFTSLAVLKEKIPMRLRSSLICTACICLVLTMYISSFTQ